MLPEIHDELRHIIAELDALYITLLMYCLKYMPGV